MSNKINNNSSRIFCLSVISICILLSCNNNQGKAKLITKKLPNGITKVIGATINGKKEGMWINYDDSGRISSCYTYINDSLLGQEISYWEDGTISSKRFLKGNEIQGEWIEYYDFDKTRIAKKGVYKNGKKIGVCEYYLEDGRLNKKIEYSEKGEKVVLDNHLMPPTPSNMSPQSITDTNNNALVK